MHTQAQILEMLAHFEITKQTPELGLGKAMRRVPFCGRGSAFSLEELLALLVLGSGTLLIATFICAFVNTYCTRCLHLEMGGQRR